MSKEREALKLALEALEDAKKNHGLVYVTELCAIREALAEQPAQKRPQNCGTGYCSCIECLFEQPAQQQEPVGRFAGSFRAGDGRMYFEVACHPDQPLPALMSEIYTSPPASKPWVGLMRGVRVEGDRVVISVKGGNDSARELCGELLREKNA